MKNFNTYGKSPFNIVVVHGGPGATSGVAAVAKKLSENYGVLEPLQTQNSVTGQIEELKTVIKEHSDLPVILIGHSWGAWLCFMVAAQYPDLVKKLILVSSAPFEESYATNIAKTRLDRLSDKDKMTVGEIVEKLRDPSITNEDIDQFIKFIVAVDSYNPVFYEAGQKFNVEIFRSVWAEAAKLRSSGQLLTLCSKIQCPVVATHGDYDPHPYQGVKEPLSAVLKDFKFILLKYCGHTPWIEKEARDIFLKR